LQCGYDLDESGDPFPDQFEGKKKRILKAVAAAEAQPVKKRASPASEHVRPARPGEKVSDEHYRRPDDGVRSEEGSK
jgi:hypothetical protein